MKNIVVKIDSAMVNAIRARQMELEGYKNLWSYAVSNPPYDIPQEKIDELEQKYINTNAEYNLLKNQLEDEYIPKDYDRNKVSWNLDFDAQEMAIVEND